MMEPPPPRTISGTACLQVSIWLWRFTSSVRCQTSSDRSVTAVSRVRKSESVSAALLCRMSRRPKFDVAAAMVATTWASSDRSAWNANARPPDSVIPLATSSAAAWLMSTTRTDGALPGQGARGRPADTSAAPGDDRDLVGETSHAVLSSVVMWIPTRP